MHENSMKIMKTLLASHLVGVSGAVVDFGSQDINGSYRHLFGEEWEYTGADAEDGKNVDVVMVNYKAPSIKRESVDLVVSGQTIEHVGNPFKFVKEMVRVLKPGGKIILIAPFKWGEHRYPIDCWRFLPDGMQCLFDECGVEMVESKLSGDHPHQIDCYAIGVKK